MARLLRLAQVGSTQDACFALAAEGAEAGSAVVAEEQAGGRGSRGQRWSSPRGGLWLSVLFRPVAAAAPELLAVRAGLAVAAALDELGGLPPVRLKWPNDVVVADRKVGGILCEAQWAGSRLLATVIGVGINVTNDVPPDARMPALALAAWRPGLTVEQVLAPVLAHLRAIDPAAPALDRAELAAFARRDWLEGQRLAAPVAGRAAGLAPDGTLQVRTADGQLQHLRTGPVELAPAPARPQLT